MAVSLASHRWLLIATVALVAGAVTAWFSKNDHVTFETTDITGSAVGGDFAMTDHTGTPRKLSDFRGKVVVVFFGFLNCPDVCPTTLAALATAMKKLGDRADGVQVLLVTVDPDRDSPELLGRYMTAFHPTFLGLRGTPQELETAAKAFKIVYQKSPTSNGGYTMDHTASSFVLDQEGRIRLLIPHGTAAEVIARDLRRLLT